MNMVLADSPKNEHFIYEIRTLLTFLQGLLISAVQNRLELYAAIQGWISCPIASHSLFQRSFTLSPVFSNGGEVILSSMLVTCFAELSVISYRALPSSVNKELVARWSSSTAKSERILGPWSSSRVYFLPAVRSSAHRNNGLENKI